MTYEEAYGYGVTQLAQSGIAESKMDATLLLEYVTGLSRNEILQSLLMKEERTLLELDQERYQLMIQQRAAHVPIQHLTGEQEFMGLTFRVNEHVLIPRQDTEFLVEEALFHIHDGMKLLDVCTGSGCILLSAMHYKNHCVGVGVDISVDALEVAKENAKQLEIEAVFLESDLLEGVTGKYDVVMSNPPYIRSDVIPTLMEEVRGYEPHLALDGREDGLYYYRRLVEELKPHLNRGAWVLFEIGYDQGEEVVELMQKAGYANVEVKKDYAGNPRVVKGFYTE